uniref:Symplekin n=1 Tax=Phallusia mammillata TaxID=59560 RepID=A0A6F9DTJ0_9ASCI|nr:symplekin [Phallusia mammillata]
MDPRVSRGGDPRNRRQKEPLSSRSAKEFAADDAEKEEKISTFDMVINLLNQASMAKKDSEKVEKLQQVQELVINKQPELLDNFTDEVVAFQADRSSDVRKFVVGFMEEACKKEQELLSKLLSNFYMLLVDDNVNVLKKVIQSSTQLYRLSIQWVSSSKASKELLEASWKTVCDIQDTIFQMLDSENDGVRTQSVKFVEKVVLTLSERQRYSEIPKKVESYSSLDQIPNNNPVLIKADLVTLCQKALQKMLEFVSSPAISSVNLMAAMGTLTTIAKQRPQFMASAVEAFEMLHANLPPTLAKTQVTSVRKHLKMQLMNLLRHAGSTEFHLQITNLLYDLGTNATEIARNMPKPSAVAKDKKSIARKRSPLEASKELGAEKSSKKPKMELKEDYEEDVYGDEDKPGGSGTQVSQEEAKATSSRSVKPQHQASAIDITADELVPLLNPENVANLVLLSMVMLPDKIPDAFQASYTPIESAGTMEQIMHLARLLATQMTAVGIGSGIQQAAEMQAEEEAKKQMEKEKQEMELEKSKPSVPIQTVIGGTTASEEIKEPEEVIVEKKISLEPVQPIVPSKGLQRRMQGFHLASITKPLSLDAKDRIIKMSVLRVLKSERSAIAGGVHHRWQKVLTSLVAQFGGDLHRSLAKFILSDLRNRSQLAFQWLYEEFNIFLENSRGPNDRAAQENYDACLTGLLQGLLEKQDAREGLFTKLVLQAPLLTENVVRLIKTYCEDERRSHAGLLLVKELIAKRPPRKMQFVRVLLDLGSNRVEKVRKQAIQITKKLYENRNLQEFIEQHAVTSLSYLTQKEPPENLLPPNSEGQEKAWTEDAMKQSMSLFLALLPQNHSLIHKLADVYVEANADIKRVVLRALEAPVHGMGMASPELLRMVEGCPKGAETLVTRMLHILTDREHPSSDLVYRVRELYQKRVPDVRFLIPVLNGLEKHEVLLALPKLIRLNPPVVKGVFNRLLGVQRHHDSEPSVSALSPVELLVALHNIDPSKADVKCVIKATSLCFAEKAVYTSEVLVTVINQLVEQETMPTLLMRTVIQALITYPRLSGFVMNVLQRLILKRVWEQTKVWEGFVRCCQRMKPQSFQVLLQLPPAQLSNVFETLTDLREPLLQYVNKFTPQQRQHISPAIISVLESTPEQRKAELAAIENQRLLEEMRVREREAQQRVAHEWERQEQEQRKKQEEASAQIEMIKKQAEIDQESERRVQEQKERAKALADFQQKGVKDEPQDGEDAFPAMDTTPADASGVTALPSDAMDTLPASTGNLSTAVSETLTDTKPVVVSTDQASSVAPATSQVTLQPSILPQLTQAPPSTIIIPPGLTIPYGIPPPNVIIPPPGVISQQFVQPIQEVKREQRSPTPTQDERPEEKS